MARARCEANDEVGVRGETEIHDEVGAGYNGVDGREFRSRGVKVYMVRELRT